jgi:hypothetical protein
MSGSPELKESSKTLSSSQKQEKEKKSRVNNITSRPSTYCCGMTELGNFNYVDPPDGKKMTHYHMIGGSWATQQNQEPSTKEDLVNAMKYLNAAVLATTGAGQEYMDPILEEVGFRHVFTFVNPGHAQTPVKVWCYAKNSQVVKY